MRFIFHCSAEHRWESESDSPDEVCAQCGASVHEILPEREPALEPVAEGSIPAAPPPRPVPPARADAAATAATQPASVAPPPPRRHRLLVPLVDAAIVVALLAIGAFAYLGLSTTKEARKHY